MATTTWNPSDKAANITLSNGNLTAVANTTGNWNIVRSTTSHSAGKYYIEYTTTGEQAGAGHETVGLGIANASQNISTAYLGDTSNNGLALFQDGHFYLNSGSGISLGVSFVTGDTVGTAIDFGNSKIWYRNGAGNWNNDVIANQNPATNTGGQSFSTLNAGPYFAALEVDNATAPDGARVNFGALSFAHSAPSGFIGWDSAFFSRYHYDMAS